MAIHYIDVIGSLNIDLITRISRIPNPGETLAASSFNTGFGGKGANQAVACARLLPLWKGRPIDGSEGRVSMIGAVGSDQYGSDFIKHLAKEHVNTNQVFVCNEEKTGTAVIIVEEQTGENRIMYSAGANYSFRSNATFENWWGVGLVVLQLEIPLHTVLYILRKAKKQKREIILNPAPAVVLPDEVYDELDHLILNESEAAILRGISEERLAMSLDETANYFIERGVHNVVITLGSKGVYYQTQLLAQGGKLGIKIPARQVEVVDTTAAGDTFVGAYAAMRAQFSDEEANMSAIIDFANRAASIAVQTQGAQGAIPFLADVPIEGSSVLQALFEQ